MRIPKLLLILFITILQGATMIDGVLAKDNMTDDLNKYVRSEVPGLQYVAVTADRVLFEYAGGWADIQGQKAMTSTSSLA